MTWQRTGGPRTKHAGGAPSGGWPRGHVGARVGLYSHTILFFCRTGAGARIVRFRLNGDDRVDPSPRDHDQSTCSKSHLSNTLDARHVAKRGGTDRHQTAEAFRDRRHYVIIRSSSDGCNHSQPSRRAWSLLVRLISIEQAGSSSRSDLHRTALDD